MAWPKCGQAKDALRPFFFDPPGDLPVGASAGFPVRAVLALNGLAVFALGVMPNALIQLCARVIG